MYISFRAFLGPEQWPVVDAVDCGPHSWPGIIAGKSIRTSFDRETQPLTELRGEFHVEAPANWAVLVDEIAAADWSG